MPGNEYGGYPGGVKTLLVDEALVLFMIGPTGVELRVDGL